MPFEANNTMIYILNIEKKISNNVWQVTGPGIMTRLRNDPQSEVIFERFDFQPARFVRQYVLFKHDLDYKSGKADWRKFQHTDAASIFQD